MDLVYEYYGKNSVLEGGIWFVEDESESWCILFVYKVYL